MRKRIAQVLAALALGVGAANGQWVSQGFVFCDANTNNVIDAGDVPLQNLVVVTTNTAGTYSNAVLTSFLGEFMVTNLPAVTASYRTFVLTSSLPAGTLLVTPTNINFNLSAGVTNVTNNFLVRATNCASLMPSNCWLQGGGTIKPGGRGKPTFTFSLNAAPNCETNGIDDADLGRLNVLAHNQKLHFKGEVFEIVNCGTATGTNFVEFHGIGTAKGIAGNKTDYGLVHFYARVEDAGEGADRLYLRVYTDAGQTLLVISGQPGSPTVVAPLAISTGELEVVRATCANPPAWADHEEDEE